LDEEGADEFYGCWGIAQGEYIAPDIGEGSHDG